MFVWRSFRYRLKLTTEQKQLLREYNRRTRIFWNQVLEIQKKRIEKRNFYSPEETESMLTTWHSESPDYRNMNIQPFRITLRHQHKAINYFLSGKKNFPNEKLIEKGGKIHFTSGIKFYEGEFFIPLIGKLKFIEHRPVEGVVRRLTIMLRGGKWEVSILLLIERPDQTRSKDNSVTLGIDLGVKNFATLSDGTIIEPLNSLERLFDRITREDKRLTRKIPGSKNWEKQRLKLEKLYVKASNRRTDFLHKVTTKIASEHLIVAMEDLDILKLTTSWTKPESAGPVVRNPKLSRLIHDQGWCRFKSMLNYKLQERGGRLILVDPKNTSIKCSKCSCLSQSNRITRYVFHCVSCEHTANADVNAAMNIFAAGAAVIALGQ